MNNHLMYQNCSHTSVVQQDQRCAEERGGLKERKGGPGS